MYYNFNLTGILGILTYVENSAVVGVPHQQPTMKSIHYLRNMRRYDLDLFNAITLE